MFTVPEPPFCNPGQLSYCSNLYSNQTGLTCPVTWGKEENGME